jgi:hypothetical protein
MLYPPIVWKSSQLWQLITLFQIRQLSSARKPNPLERGQGRPIHAENLKFLESTVTRLERWSWENACHAQIDIEEEDERRDVSTWFIKKVFSGW